MTTTNNITSSTVTINNYTTTDHINEPIGSIPTKVCNKCFQIKQLIEFHKRKDTYDGYRNQCKSVLMNYIKNIIKKIRMQWLSIRKNIIKKIKMK